MQPVRNVLIAIVALALLSPIRAQSADAESGPAIKHFVVLMLENRAFDHMLGFMGDQIPGLHGLVGNETNLIDPSQPSTSAVATVNQQAPYVDPNLEHSTADTAAQIQYGAAADTLNAAPMNGFAANAQQHHQWGAHALSCFNSTSLPVLSTLAREFGVIDHYHSSVPGPTMVNRMFAFSGTSDGACNNDVEKLVEGYPQATMFDALDRSHVSFRVYFSDGPTSLCLKEMRSKRNLLKFRPLESFYKEAASGHLPAFSWIDPAYFGIPDVQKPTDQHPSHDVVYGEELIKNVYDALRASPVWNHTVLMVTYDEHGGFYDSVPTPLTGVPSPDGKVCTDPVSFNFERLGVRVPAVIVSPWVNAQTVLHTPTGPTPTSQFEHTSIISTVFKLFNVKGGPLTQRDAWAGTFEEMWQQRSTPRTDTPLTMPAPPVQSAFFEGVDEHELRKQPMSGLQQEILYMSHVLIDPTLTAQPDLELSEAEGGLQVLENIRSYFANHDINLDDY